MEPHLLTFPLLISDISITNETHVIANDAKKSYDTLTENIFQK